MIQRYLALPTLRAGRQALWIFVLGVIVLMFLCSYNGLLIYATYKHCDPLTTKVLRMNCLNNKLINKKCPLIACQGTGSIATSFRNGYS